MHPSVLISFAKKFFVLGFLVSSFILFCIIQNTPRDDDRVITKHVQKTSIANQACVAPKLQLWHPALKQYFKKVPPLMCDQVEENWVYSQHGRFRISASAREKHGQIICEFQPLLRGEDDFTVRHGDPIKPISDGDPMPADYGEVKCIGGDDKVHKNLMLGISPLPAFKTSTKTLPVGATGMNILMFGFDSTSRMTWMRNLPKTHEYFTKVLNGTVMEGYNILGDGTPPAMLPILTGFTEKELPEARRGYKGADTVDNHPWIWNQLHEAGYVTQYGEDMANAGTFTYRMLGFKDQPVKHYLRPFALGVEPHKQRNKPFCLGSQPRHKTIMNWVKEFYDVYSKVPKFSFIFHSEFSHRSCSQLQLVDDDLLEMIRTLHQDGYLDNTLLILMSDHGARFQKVREHTQGKYEERLPYFSLRFPTKFQNKYPHFIQNLKNNANHLTTPFDVHATFEHLLNFTGKDMKGSVKTRGVSLLKAISKERTCVDAGVKPHWCACLNFRKFSIESAIIQKAAKSLVSTMNNVTRPYRSLCAALTLDKIVFAFGTGSNSDASVTLRDSERKSDKGDVFYQLTIITAPGGGKFESTLRYYELEDRFETNLDEISRINAYGSQPHCVEERLPHLRPYCVCGS